MSRAVVFAYHNVGVRCLEVLLAQGVEISLVVTHQDNPNETIWFDSVVDLARLHDIPVITPDDPNTPETLAAVTAAAPDFLFSFYYRNMLKAPLLAVPKRGAFNMHGSLLPQYRGRVPVNWAIIRGERETGATLHVMNEKPDNGAIVDQTAVPILPNDTARQVFDKVVVAAEITLYRCLPSLLDGTAQLTPQDLSQGGYFGGRKAEDGRIDWQQPARDIHNLVRAVAPPYPGAHCQLAGLPMLVTRTLPAPAVKAATAYPALFVAGDRIYASCGDGQVLRLLEFTLAGKPTTAADLIARFGHQPRALTD